MFTNPDLIDAFNELLTSYSLKGSEYIREQRAELKLLIDSLVEQHIHNEIQKSPRNNKDALNLLQTLPESSFNKSLSVVLMHEVIRGSDPYIEDAEINGLIERDVCGVLLEFIADNYSAECTRLKQTIKGLY